jgi:Skp family chaperone for outer membrane proteins
MIVLVGVAAVGGVAYITNHLRAQGPEGQQLPAAAAAAPAPKMKIALVNMTVVLRNYEKWKTFQNQFKTDYENYKKQADAKAAEVSNLKTQYSTVTTPEQKDQIEQRSKTLQREIQDLETEAKKQLAKMEADAAVQVYKEVQAAVQAFARANDIEVVFQYLDGTTEGEVYSPYNIERKLSTQPMVPIYAAPGIDVSEWIYKMLNQRLQASAAGVQH